MRYLIIGTVIVLLTIQSFGQDCSLVSDAKDRKTGIITKSAIVKSKDYYSLLIQKEINTKNPDDTLTYSMSLVAASRIKLSDSLIKSMGSFKFQMNNGTTITLNNAKCFNNALGNGASIGFRVKLSERQFRQMINQSIRKVKVFDILETEFSIKNQKQIQTIVNCMLYDEKKSD